MTSIGTKAFKGCSSLVSVIVPSSVEKIGEEAFSECSSLDNVSIDVEEIPYECFDNCSSLKTVIIGPKTKRIHQYAFAGGVIEKFYSYAENAPELFYRNYNLGGISGLLRSAKLYVPYGCKDKYNYPWTSSDAFQKDNIIEMDK